MKLLTTALLLHLTTLIAAQDTGTLSGTVQSADSIPLAFATIEVLNTPRTTLTNTAGNFHIKDVPAGQQTLQITAAGYTQQTTEVTIIPGATTTIRIMLEEDVQVLAAIEVIDDQSGLTNRTPYNVTSVSAKDITLKSNPSGLMGFLREEPGLYGAEMGHGIVKPFIRGLGFSRVVTIYQGNKLENHPWGADHGMGVNDLGVGRIDVIKGPASVLYGSGAIGGVILVKDDESYMYKNKWTGNVGTTFNSVSGGARTFGSLGRQFSNGFFIAADAAYENHADYKDGNGRIIGNSRFNTQAYRFHVGVNKKNFSNKLSYTYIQQNLGIIEDDEMDDEESLATTRHDRRMQLPFQDVQDHVISYKQTSVHDKFTVALNVSQHFNLRDEIEDAFDEVDLGLRQAHTFYNARVSHKTTDIFENTVGVQGSLIRFRNKEGANDILIPDANFFENGLYYLGGLTLGKYFVQGGLRYDHREVQADASAQHLIDNGFTLPGDPVDRKLSRSFSGFTGSLGVSRRWKEKHVFKFNVSTGYRAPDLAELFSNGPHPGTNRFEVGNANFGREQSYQADLSWAYNTKKLTTSVSVFANMVDNFLFFSATGDTMDNGLDIWEFQQTDALLYGTEVFIGYSPLENNRLELLFQASIVRGEQRNTDEHLTFVPADNYMATIKFRPLANKNTAIFTSLRYVDDHTRPGFNEENTPGYMLLNAGVNHRFAIGENTLTASISGFNLLNQVYTDHMSILRAFNVTSPGRNLMVTLLYGF